MMIPIDRRNISSQIADQILEKIINEGWESGTKLPSENELTQIFSVSRVPIREALQQLSTLGIIQTKHGEGTYVAELTSGMFMNSLLPMLVLNKRSMMDILEYRRMVEPESAALAALNADDEDIRRMEVTLAEMERIREPVIAFSVADLAFHLEVAKATKNSVLFNVSYIIKNILINYYKKINEIMGIERAIKYHGLVLTAIKERDAEQARMWMKEHINTTVEDVSYKYKE